MFLNIITPCSRPANLAAIERSITIPRDRFRWIVVFDAPAVPDVYIPPIAEPYAHQNPSSGWGHAQRNFALDRIEVGHVYFNDDDTAIHPHLWEYVGDRGAHDFISFSQVDRYMALRLKGDDIRVQHIDSHNFIVDSRLCRDVRFDITKYWADGVFAVDCYRHAKSPLFIDRVLSVYNSLQ